MEREFEILQKINKRKVALKKQEKLRKREVDKMNEKNVEKLELNQKWHDQNEEEKRRSINQLKRKEKELKKKMQEIENQRLADLEVKKERQRLVMEDAQKKQEIQKRNANFKKLEVLDKHSKIEDLCNKLDSNKKQFIESSRIANEIRVLKMV